MTLVIIAYSTILLCLCVVSVVIYIAKIMINKASIESYNQMELAKHYNDSLIGLSRSITSEISKPKDDVQQRNHDFMVGNNNMIRMVMVALYKMNESEDMFGFEEISKTLSRNIDEFNHDQKLLDEWMVKFAEYQKNNSGRS